MPGTKVNTALLLLLLTVACGCASSATSDGDTLRPRSSSGDPAAPRMRPNLQTDADTMRVVRDTWHHLRHGVALVDAGENEKAWLWLRALAAELDRWMERRGEPMDDTRVLGPVPRQGDEPNKVEGTPDDPDVQGVLDRADEQFREEGMEP